MEWAAWKPRSAPGGVRTNLTTINANTAPLRFLEFKTRDRQDEHVQNGTDFVIEEFYH
jgi:hypothetical protein